MRWSSQNVTDFSKPVSDVATTVPKVENFGVDRDKLPALQVGEAVFSSNGRSLSPKQAYQLLGAGNTLVDDSHRLRLTVIGSKEDCERVLQDLAISEFADTFLVQAYRPAHWAVANTGFLCNGAPSIILQTPSDSAGRGRVLHAQHDYQGGFPQLASALRKADATYRPENDPDLRRAGFLRQLLTGAPSFIVLFFGVLFGVLLAKFFPVLVQKFRSFFAAFKKSPRPDPVQQQILELLQHLREKNS